MTNQLPTLELKVKNEYGNFRYFPDCEISRALCDIREKKTLTRENIDTLAKAGFKFRIYDKDGHCEFVNPPTV